MEHNQFFKGFKKALASEYGAQEALRAWQEANCNYAALKTAHRDLDSDSRMLILPAAAIYQAKPEDCLYCEAMRQEYAKTVLILTTIIQNNSIPLFSIVVFGFLIVVFKV